jgi:glycosyltransferase involved in cell wall biosynthesis
VLVGLELLMEILLLEPFMVGSHAAWANEYAAHSDHHVQILGLEGKYWKWRLHGGAVTLARQFLESGMRPDLLLATDMLDLPTFLALTRKVTAGIPSAVYFHENQLSYPWSPTDADPGLQRDAHYSFINYTSALVADSVLFNSDYHRQDFLAELPGFLGSFPDNNESDTVARIAMKSRTLHLGLDLQQFDRYRPVQGPADNRPPLLLWNHRWEYDKNPEEFFHALFALQEQGIAFELVVLGESYKKQPAVFAEARKKLHKQIVHWGYAENFADYAAWLWRADLLPVTSHHDFFGASVVQAIYCHCQPLLPRRLSYPEHLPGPLHEPLFYDSFAALVAQLTHQCLNVAALRTDKLAALVAGYDWRVQAGRYDRLFTELVDHC